MRHYTYTLRIESTDTVGVRMTNADQVELQNALQDVENVVNERLPEGFYCKIDEVRDGDA
jgi:hypothetical protein